MKSLRKKTFPSSGKKKIVFSAAPWSCVGREKLAERAGAKWAPGGQWRGASTDVICMRGSRGSGDVGARVCMWSEARPQKCLGPPKGAATEPPPSNLLRFRTKPGWKQKNAANRQRDFFHLLFHQTVFFPPNISPCKNRKHEYMKKCICNIRLQDKWFHFKSQKH